MTVRRLRDGAVNLLRRVKDRVVNEPAIDAAVVALAAFLVDTAGDADPAELAAAAADHPWAVAFIAAAGVAVRQSVYSRRSHDLDEEWAAMGDRYLTDLEPFNMDNFDPDDFPRVDEVADPNVLLGDNPGDDGS